jgi:hypothetical protein
VKVIPLCLVLLTTLSLPSLAQTSGGFDSNCRPASQEDWPVKQTYNFSHQGKSYKLIWSQSVDGTGFFCLAQGNSARPIADKFTGDSFVDRLDRVSAKVFTFQIHDGNGNNAPYKKYRLNLENPQQPKITLIKKWVE